MKCEKCGEKDIKWKRNETYEGLDEHHIIPKKYDGTDADGRINLCRKCHKEIHKIIDNLVPLTINNIKEKTKEWLNDSKTT